MRFRVGTNSSPRLVLVRAGPGAVWTENPVRETRKRPRQNRATGKPLKLTRSKLESRNSGSWWCDAPCVRHRWTRHGCPAIGRIARAVSAPAKDSRYEAERETAAEAERARDARETGIRVDGVRHIAGPVRKPTPPARADHARRPRPSVLESERSFRGYHGQSSLVRNLRGHSCVHA